MHQILGLSPTEWAAIFTMFSIVVGSIIGIIKYFKLSITEPLYERMDRLSDSIDEMNQSRKANEGKIFNTLDDHTKEIGEIYGRVNTLEVITQSNTTRLDRTLK